MMEYSNKTEESCGAYFYSIVTKEFVTATYFDWPSHYQIAKWQLFLFNTAWAYLEFVNFAL